MNTAAQSNAPLNVREKHRVDLIEAALYAAGRPLDLDTLSTLANAKPKDARLLIEQLTNRYRETNGALELLKLQDGRFVMQLRPNLVPGVMRLVTRKLLTRGPLKTLSFIAIKQPVTQAYVAKVRGNLAYGHIRVLCEKGLVSEERLGRTKVLRTTTAFSDYFSLSGDPRVMKNQLEKMFEQLRVRGSNPPRSGPARTPNPAED